jgi:hypothetical protein
MVLLELMLDPNIRLYWLMTSKLLKELLELRFTRLDFNVTLLEMENLLLKWLKRCLTL